jgi:hypothetical protein
MFAHGSFTKTAQQPEITSMALPKTARIAPEPRLTVIRNPSRFVFIMILRRRFFGVEVRGGEKRLYQLNPGTPR